LAPPPTAAAPAPVADRISAPPASSLRTSSEPAARTGDELAIRVSVRSSVGEPGLFVVRKLESGQAIPPGTTEAVLVFLNSNAASSGK